MNRPADRPPAANGPSPTEVPSASAASDHVPLTQRLERLLADEKGGDIPSISLNLLLERTDGRGMYLVMILLCLPFIAPITIPGSSLPFGLAVALLGLETLRRRPPRLPRFLGNRPLSGRLRRIIVDGGIWILKRLEKKVRPRRCEWLERRPVKWLHALMFVFWGLFMSLPFPPLVPPMSNNFPAYAIILLAVSLMEEDGALIRVAYGFSLFNLVYFAFWGELIWKLFMNWEQTIERFLGVGG